MSIAQRAFYHGAALSEITQNESFTSINNVPSVKSSHAYQLNHNIGIFIKHTTTNISGNWWFTFPIEHQSIVKKLSELYADKTYLIFVCEDIGICIINYRIFSSCIDLNQKESEWFEIYRVDGGSFRVRGAQNEYNKTIPLNAFPRVLFEKI